MRQHVIFSLRKKNNVMDYGGKQKIKIARRHTDL